MTALGSTDLNAFVYEKIWDLGLVSLTANKSCMPALSDLALVSGSWRPCDGRAVCQIQVLPQFHFCYYVLYIHHRRWRPVADLSISP